PIPPDLIAKIRGDRLPPRPTSDSRPDEGPLPPTDSDLFAVLRKWRNEIASQSMLPPYRVLSNATLEELARRQPDSPEALLEVKGIGPAKLEQYGSQLLALLTKTGSHETAPEDVTKVPEVPDGPPLSDAWEEAEPGVPEPFSFGPLDEPPSHHEPSLEAPAPNPDAAAGHGQTLEPTDTTPIHAPHQDALPSPTQSGAAGPRGSDVKPNHYWTWRLLSDGFSIEECEAIRGIQRETIVGHLLRALEDGWEVRAEWCLPASLIRALEAVVGSQRPTEIRPLLAKLPAGASHAEVQLFLKCRSRPSHG
ncbi:MAG: HRDC domain-containing protein, partial [Planctomycetes bacterium]|nr:HRDC domain-containing protein [Planctomycetota bacterium]